MLQSQTNSSNPLLPFLNETDQYPVENNEEDQGDEEGQEENDDVHVIPIHAGI